MKERIGNVLMQGLCAANQRRSAIAAGSGQTGSGLQGDWLADRAANDNNHDLERIAA